jgi:CheY-like chemotaxis protein
VSETTSAFVPHEGCVLVVDDEEDIRETLREVVEMVGCSAVLAANGLEAMQILARHQPCLIILDLTMPGMSGEELIDAMRLQPELAGLPVVISTSAPGRAPPGLPVIPKPVDIEKLWAMIRSTCHCAL